MEYHIGKMSGKILGRFECVLTSIESKRTQEGRTYWQFNFKVRDDVEKNPIKARNKNIIEFINYGEFYKEGDERKLSAIVNTQDIGDGGFTFASENEIIDRLKGLLCQVDQHEYTKKDGTTGISRSYYKSDYKPKVLEQHEVEEENTYQELSDDELPF